MLDRLVHSLIGLLCQVSDGFTKLNSRASNIKGNYPEIICFVFYVVARALVAFYHEPWYDEIQAWQIARCASYHDILFLLPHYEGHPPLWHLVLSIFAKNNVDFLFSLNFVNALFTGITVYLILFKSPFPRLLKLCLPFTYFYFYQYGVLARPYAMMMLAFCLVAMTYKNRNEQPGRYVLSMMFLCLTSAYGILFAGGFALVWVGELYKEKQGFKGFISALCKDARTLWLFALLILAIILTIEFYPYPKAYNVGNAISINNFIKQAVPLAYTFFVMPADNFWSNVLHEYGKLGVQKFAVGSFLIACMLGLMVNFYAFSYGKQKKTVWLYFLPYFMFAAFCGLVHAYIHHTGIYMLFFVCWLWISMEQDGDDVLNIPESCSEHNAMLLQKFAVFLMGLSMLINVSWSSSVAVHEIKFIYYPGKHEAQFVKENNLDKYKVFAGWDYQEDRDNAGAPAANNTNTLASLYLWPYMDSDIAYNKSRENQGDQNYIFMYFPDEEEAEPIIDGWRKFGKPEVILGHPPLKVLFKDGSVTYKDYALVFSEPSTILWKRGGMETITDMIFVRRDLLSQTSVKEITNLKEHFQKNYGVEVVDDTIKDW